MSNIKKPLNFRKAKKGGKRCGKNALRGGIV